RIYRASPDLREISRQSVRAGTAIGALLEEADAGHSKADFAAKVGISLKEARESRYWLRILHRHCEEERATIEKLGSEVTEIIAILTTIVKKSRS
ncbi:MAG: four helix bundle protein, partial [Thermoanaerobaculia bacterium]